MYKCNFRLKKLTGLREDVRSLLYCIQWCTIMLLVVCVQTVLQLRENLKEKYAESSKDGVRIGFRFPDGHKTFHCFYPSDTTKVRS